MEIDIDEENGVVTILSGGKEYIFESIALFAGDAQHKEMLIQMFGSSADAAWTYAQGFVMAQQKQGSAMNNFYKQCAAHICQAIDPVAFKNEVQADELLNKWECQDQCKWAGWDTEDVLVDKQKSEDKKKVWN
jgi:hypothetical protein